VLVCQWFRGSIAKALELRVTIARVAAAVMIFKMRDDVDPKQLPRLEMRRQIDTSSAGAQRNELLHTGWRLTAWA
jgi:hypothetical protein